MEKSNVFATLQVIVSESIQDAYTYNDNQAFESVKQVNRSYLMKYSGTCNKEHILMV